MIEEEADRLDKSFERVVLFIGISYATIVQLFTWIFEPPIPQQTPGQAYILLSVVRLIFIPLLIIILIWLGKFVATGPKKIFFRKLARSWGMLQLAIHILSTILLVTTDLSRDSIYLKMGILPCFILVPAITYVIYRKIISLYKKATSESVFWRNKWWDHGTTLVAILSMALFFIFVYFLPHPL